MSDKTWLFTSESVSEGHPDKVCDRISDSVLDAYLAAEPQARVACETLATTDHVVIAGEVRGPGEVRQHVEELAREAIRDIGYDQKGFSWKTCAVENLLHEQSATSPWASTRATRARKGAGDQGIMFGYACNETDELMPAPIQFPPDPAAHGRGPQIGRAAGLRPRRQKPGDAEIRGGSPVGVDTVVVSTQHAEDVTQDDIRAMVKPYIERASRPSWSLPDDKLIVNPTGKFVIGGPDGDAGLTGRKIIVDTYGGAAPHGGGAFSGKDPSKVDRSAAYVARYLAKNVVAAGLADKCQIQLAYAIGVPEPVALYVNTLGTGRVDEDKLARRCARWCA